MFLCGVQVDHASASAFLVIMGKSLKNVRHYYAVKEIRRTPASGCRDEVLAFYSNSVYTIRKRIFSQDRRPKKDVSARPTIVIAARREEMSLIESLREKDVPVEAVWLTDSPGGLPDLAPVKAGTGGNHRASEQMIYETLSCVSQQQRLALPANPPPRNELFERLGPMLCAPRGLKAFQPDDRLPPLLLAAAVPIWFKENIKYSIAYRTSATSVRSYI